MSRTHPALAWSHGAFMGMVVCGIVFAGVNAWNDGVPSIAQQNLPKSAFDTKDYLGIRTEVGEIKLRIVDQKTFDMEDGGRNSGAFTYPAKKPCEIVIPAGWTIHFRPYYEEAFWDGQWYGSTFAHEILHCMVPDWHDGYTQRLATVKAATAHLSGVNDK